MKFSNRYGYDPRQPKEPILEDASEWVRVAYFDKVLIEFTYIDNDRRYPNDTDAPLGTKALHEKFCYSIREETDATYYDSAYCEESLKDHLRSTPWYHFYDFVELVGTELKLAEINHSFDDKWLEKFGFESYRANVNRLFSQERIAWRLNPESVLIRTLPSDLEKRMNEVDAQLKDKFAPAREHFKKARRYCMEHPLDPENSIKEIVSSLESVARTLFPGATTLGDALKEMRKKSYIPRMLIPVFEKFYAYANAEPAVRHGSSFPSSVNLMDAELALHTGLALIRYLIQRSELKPEGR